MRIVTVTAAMVVLATPAYAQKGAPESKTPLQIQDELRRREQAETERQYEKMKRTGDPAAAAKSDPWSNMRSTTPVREKR